MSFKVGDYARIVGNTTEHNFQINSVVCVDKFFDSEISGLRYYTVHDLNNAKNTWIVVGEEIAPATIADKFRQSSDKELANLLAETFLAGAKSMFQEAHGEDTEFPLTNTKEYIKAFCAQLKKPWKKD